MKPIRKRNKGYKKRLLSIFLFISIIFSSFTGCKQQKATDDYSHSTNDSSTSSNTKTKNVAFEQFLTETFQDMVSTDSLSLHYSVKDPSSFGIAPIAPTFGEFTKKENQWNEKHLKSLQKQLHSFSKKSLSPSQQQDYAILDSALTSSITDTKYYHYSTVLSPVIGLQAQLPVLLAEYRFDTKKDVEDYLLLLADLPRYFGQIIEFEQEKVKKGYGMQDFALSDIMTQCNDFLEDIESEDHFLISSFESRLANLEETKKLSKEEQADFQSTNQYLVKNDIKNAYQSLLDALSSFEGKATIEGGLSQLPKGKEYYQFLVSSTTGTDLSINEIKKQIEAQLKKGQLDTLVILKKYPDIFDEYSSASCPITEPDEILSTLKSQITKDFPKAPPTICELKTVDQTLSEHLSPAFYFIPPVDSITSNVIYINSLSSSYDKETLYPTLAHEGYPGHLYQNTYFYSTNPNPIRSILNFGGYSEGWATYVEYHSYETIDYGEHSKEIATLNQYEMDLSLGLCAIIDLCVNGEGWTLDDCQQFLKEHGINDSRTALSIYHSVIEEPANYLQYYVGFLQFEQLRETTKELLGETFDPISFHKTILDLGPSPFSVVKQALEQEFHIKFNEK